MSDKILVEITSEEWDLINLALDVAVDHFHDAIDAEPVGVFETILDQYDALVRLYDRW